MKSHHQERKSARKQRYIMWYIMCTLRLKGTLCGGSHKFSKKDGTIRILNCGKVIKTELKKKNVYTLFFISNVFFQLNLIVA